MIAPWFWELFTPFLIGETFDVKRYEMLLCDLERRQRADIDALNAIAKSVNRIIVEVNVP